MIDLDENKRELQDIKLKFTALETTIGKEDELASKLKKLEEKTLVPDFWDDYKNANVILADIKDVKSKYTSIVKVKNDIENLIETNEFLLVENDEEMALELIKSTALLKEEIERLEIQTFLSGKFDRNNAIITLHPGARRN